VALVLSDCAEGFISKGDAVVVGDGETDDGLGTVLSGPIRGGGEDDEEELKGRHTRPPPLSGGCNWVGRSDSYNKPTTTIVNPSPITLHLMLLLAMARGIVPIRFQPY